MGDGYRALSYIIGLVAGVITWLYAIATWGFLLGVGFGWIPAVLVGIVVGFLWPIAALGILLVVLLLVNERSKAPRSVSTSPPLPYSAPVSPAPTTAPSAQGPLKHATPQRPPPAQSPTNEYLRALERPISSDRIEGSWVGTYLCAQGPAKLSLRIASVGSTSLEAEFTFGPLPSNPGIPSGRFRMAGTIDSAGIFQLSGTEWLDQPETYEMVSLSGLIAPGAQSLYGSIPECSHTRFTLYRK